MKASQIHYNYILVKYQCDCGYYSYLTSKSICTVLGIKLNNNLLKTLYLH